jgi:hypothetical protein
MSTKLSRLVCVNYCVDLCTCLNRKPLVRVVSWNIAIGLLHHPCNLDCCCGLISFFCPPWLTNLETHQFPSDYIMDNTILKKLWFFYLRTIYNVGACWSTGANVSGGRWTSSRGGVSTRREGTKCLCFYYGATPFLQECKTCRFILWAYNMIISSIT